MSTTTAPHVVSAISGGALRPWHYAATLDQQQEVIDRLLGEPAGHVLFYVWDRPAGGDGGQYPGQQLKVVYRDGYGAAHFTNSDPVHGPVGAWLALTETPPAEGTSLVFDPWDPERVIVSADAMVPLPRLRELATEYAVTGHRPGGARWRAVDFV